MSTQLTTEKNAYSTAFREAMRQRAALEPSWLVRLRQESFDKFEQSGFPAVQQEEWKYTNVAAISRMKFAPVMARNGVGPDNEWLASFAYEETRNSTAVFVNGIFQPELSSLTALPAAVSALELGEALLSDQHGELVRKHFEGGVQPEDNGFTRLNTALLAS